jgi:hypothetical protein
MSLSCTFSNTAGSVGTTNVPAPPQTGSPATAPPDGQQGADQGQGGILPPNFIQSLVQQIVSQTGKSWGPGYILFNKYYIIKNL